MRASHWQDVLDFFVSNGVDQLRTKKSVVKPKKPPVDRYKLDGEFSGQYITPKQINILLHFLRGKTAEQIAKAEMLSVRTIDDYSKVLRAKFGYATKQAMVEYLNKINYQEKLSRIVKSASYIN
ncbi:MAG: hypothetical protein P1U34_06930 [Coxiellaceae bacterium]|nr:hypothetical protein [Coxiellaceae bacterium]